MQAVRNIAHGFLLMTKLTDMVPQKIIVPFDLDAKSLWCQCINVSIKFSIVPWSVAPWYPFVPLDQQMLHVIEWEGEYLFKLK